MFTGIIEECGPLLSSRVLSGGRQLEIGAKRIMGDLKVEDSVAINGVCLTVVSHGVDRFCVQAVPETLSKTSIGKLSPGTMLNLERALTPTTRMGGHFVQGHVDCVAKLLRIIPAASAKEFLFELPAEFARYVVRTGSICVEGVSLTVASVSAGQFKIALIPHTLQHTTLGRLKTGDGVNLEFDCLAKYVEGMLGLNGKKQVLDESSLRRMGY